MDDVRKELVALLPRLKRFAYSLSGSLDEAEDLVQAACEKALMRLDQFEIGTRLDSWMFRIVQNTWIDRMRYTQRRGVVNDPEAVERVAFDARIHEQMEARSALGIVRAQFARLPEGQKFVLSLVTIDGYSYEEAAQILGIPIGTVMSRLSRARRKLAEAIDTPPVPANRDRRRPQS